MMMNGSRLLPRRPFTHVAVQLLWWTWGQFKRHRIHQGGALSGKWLCGGKLTPATAVKVVVTSGSLSADVKRWKLPRESDGEDKHYGEIGARKWALRMLLTWEHAGILPNQSNPPKLTLLVRHSTVEPLCPPPVAQPWGSPQERSCGLEVLLDRHSQNYSNGFAYSAL